MGGNAVNGVRRWDADEYRIQVAALATDLIETLGTARFDEIPAYHTKESFGDCDIVISNEQLDPNWKSWIITALMLHEGDFVSNGNVFSFNYHGMQVDLISTDPIHYQSTIDYFSYNDLGNLLGRMMHKLGIKFGHRGMEIVVREPVEYGGHILKEISLSVEYSDALEILGLDVAEFRRGFDTKEDIFKFVASSKYFDPAIYLLDNRAHHSRVRDRKRKTYHEFLVWCETTKPKANFDFTNKTEHGGYSIREPFFTDIVVAKWPHAKILVDEVIADYEFNKTFKAIYNGEIVSVVTGLEGKELGKFMAAMKPLMYDEAKRYFIARPHNIRWMIQVCFKEYKLNGNIDIQKAMNVFFDGEDYDPVQ